MSILKKIRKPIKRVILFFRIKNKPKIFCISMQRTGTTSVGKFLEDHGFKTHHYNKLSIAWTEYWANGDYEKIFDSLEFKWYQAYEDNPWWMPDFYRVLFHRFPDSKFILFCRDDDRWFDSMLSHPHIKTLVNTYRHCKIYGRLDEYYERSDNNKGDQIDNLAFLEDKREHYKKIYNLYNREAHEFFKKNDPERLFYCSLEDSEKWKKLGEFLKLEIKEGYDIHANKSK